MSLLQILPERGNIVALGEDVGPVGRLHRTGGHAVNTDAVAHVVEGDGPSQRSHTTLRRAVGGPVLHSHERQHRRGVDYHAAPLPSHDWDDVLAPQKDTL